MARPLAPRPDRPPRTPAAVADVVGRSAVTVRHVLHRWNDHGPDGVADRRAGDGADPKLTPRRRAALFAALQTRPPDGGVWTGPKVARYVRDRWAVAVCPETGWRWRVAGGPRVHPPGAPPGPPQGGRHPDPPGVGKNWRRRVRRLRAAHPGKAVEVWAEARLGLEPVTRRVWWLKGCRPPSGGRTKYGWRYVYGFARPATGETFTVFLPRVKVERMADALAAFAAHADPAGRKVLVLLVDNAGWHRAKRLAVPANVRLPVLPPCTPELQPVEPFGVLVREAVANDTFDRLADLRRVIRRRCRRLAEDRATVKGAVGFRWAARMER